MAVLMFGSEEITSTALPQMPTFSADDDSFTSTAGGGDITPYTADLSDSVGDELFLQTPGAKAIAGVFALASIVVTCIQVFCCIHILIILCCIFCWSINFMV